MQLSVEHFHNTNVFFSPRINRILESHITSYLSCVLSENGYGNQDLPKLKTIAENNFKRVLICVKDLNQAWFIFFYTEVILFCI